MVNIITDPNHPTIKRLARKLPSVHERLDALTNLPGNEAKEKIHDVLHRAYLPPRGAKTIAAARQYFEKNSGVQKDTNPDSIPQKLVGKATNKLQYLDRLVKPDPRIYLYQGKEVSFADINHLGRSPIKSKIQQEIKAIDIKVSPEQLLTDIENYGFAVLETNEGEKTKIQEAFNQAQTYYQNTDVKDKKALTVEDPSIDAEYRAAKRPKTDSQGYRPMESIMAPRPFIFGDQYNSYWEQAKAQDLRLVFKDLANLLESKSQEVLKQITQMLGLPEGTLSKATHNTDQSSLRLIHCISADEQQSNSNAYFDAETQAKKALEDEYDHCVGIHTDWGPITLLPTATKAGLEFWYNDIKNNGTNSGWVRVPSKSGQIIVMPGNVGEIISGRKLRSVPHRVVSEGDRLSFAYFNEVNKDTNFDELRKKFVDQEVINQDSTSPFEEEVRPYLTSPDQPLTGENYMLYMKHRNTRKPSQELISYAKSRGLFLKA